ncbi:MAG TPA: carboxypeptidase regulatory-like domain-containing protein, partial [Acidimicrobiales bacterium]
MTDSSPLYIDAVRMAATPGQRSSGIISVHNRGGVPASGLVRTVGLGEGWTTPSFMIGPIEPGERVETSLVIDVPAGFPPCEHLGGIEIEAMDTATGSSLGPAAFADLVLVIGDGAQIQATLDPPDVVGGGRARFFISLRNRARQPMRVRIEGESPSEHLSVHFDEVEPVLPPGQTVRIQGRIKSTRPLLGPRQRLPFFVRVQGRTTPITVDGSFSQGPVLSGGLLKILAIITVVALWGSLLVLGLGKLGEHKDSNATKNADAAAAAAAASSSDSGAGGNGTGSDNSNGNGNGGGGGGAAGATETKVGGKVKSKDPAGVTVSLQPTSLVDETAQGANFEQSGQPANALGMHYGHQSVDVQQLAAQPKSTTTDQNGEWAFGGVRAPGFYLLTFSKGGYATRKFVINAPDDGSPVNLDAELLPGDGSLAGTVFGPDGGPLGGVDLAITGGTNTLTTATPTTGAVGTWGVQGLSTPGTYLITASRRGFGTETQLVDLPAGGSNGGVDIHMIAGVGSISGLVTDGSLNAPGNGAKGVNVTVTSGDLTRTVSTATVGAAGEFAIPQLPLPGKYTVTVTGDGYLPSTQIVDLDPVNVQNASLQITLTPSTGSVTGFVVGPNIVPGDPLPNPLPPDTGLDNVGITIANGTVQAKTTSATAADGKFVQNHVPPGHYVVTFEKFGYITQSAEVDVKAGETTQVPETGDPVTTGTMHLPPAPPDTINLHGAVTVTVRDQRNGDLLDPTENVVVTYTNDSHPTPQPADIQQPSGLRVVNGVALFTGIDPGLATFTVKAKHFSSQKVQVKVIPNAQVDTSVAMLRNAVVQGTVRDFNGVAVTADDLHVSAIPVNAGAGAVNVDADITKDANNHPTGEYVFNGTLDQGNWDIAATSADYLPNDPTLSPVTVTPAKTFTVDINLHQLGRIQIASVQVPNASGTLVQTGQDLTFSISGGPTSKPDQTRDASHHFPITFTGLQPGAYTITVTGTGLTQRPPTQFFAQVDQTSTATLLMANTSPPRIPLRGRIVYDLNGAPVPVGGAVVSVTGTNYVTNGNPPPPFNVIHTTVPPPFIFAGTITAADGTFSIDTTGFDFSGGDVNVTANPFFLPTFVPQTFSNVGIFGPASPTAPTDFVVQPIPGSVAGTITYDPSTATDSKTAVVGTITSPSGTGISISVNSDGSIALHDPRVTGGAVNAIRPGTYTVSFTRSGFQPGTPTLFPTGSFTVDPGGSVDLSTVLEKHGSTLITVECTDATASPATEFTPPKARVTITNGSFSSTQVASQPASGGPLTATFDDLVSSATPYNIAAHAAGCTDGTNTVTVASGGQGTQTVELNKLGSISGTVVSKINATSTTTVGVQGAAVSTTDPVSGKVFTATSDQDGNFVLAGSIGATAAADQDGLHTGSYTVSANSSSQQPATVTTPASIDNTQPNLDDITVTVVMTAKPA